MSKYDVNFKRLGLLLLPTLLRQPLMVSLLYAVISPLGYIHARFMRIREEANYRLNHNGQVCYLRAALNDSFDSELRRITVTDTAKHSGTLLVYLRETGREVLVPDRSSGRALIVNCRGYGAAGGIDFVVNVPNALRGLDESRLRAVVNTYKLVSKRFAISYF